MNTVKPEEVEEPTELKELTEEEIVKLKKTLKPGEGVIQRDDEGNVIRIIVGDRKTHDEILEEAAEKVEAKTDVVRGKLYNDYTLFSFCHVNCDLTPSFQSLALEEQAANALIVERHQTQFESDWVAQLIAKHGDDYEAMFWDKKLNEYQQTAAQLKKKCQKYLKSKSQK